MSKNIDEFISKLEKIPDKVISLITTIISIMIYLSIFLAIFLIIWGIIQWVTGWNELAGKKNIVRGVILFIIATTFIAF